MFSSVFFQVCCDFFLQAFSPFLFRFQTNQKPLQYNRFWQEKQRLSPLRSHSVASDNTSITKRGIPVKETFFLSLILQLIETSGITTLSSFSRH